MPRGHQRLAFATSNDPWHPLEEATCRESRSNNSTLQTTSFELELTCDWSYTKLFESVKNHWLALIFNHNGNEASIGASNGGRRPGSVSSLSMIHDDVCDKDKLKVKCVFKLDSIPEKDLIWYVTCLLISHLKCDYIHSISIAKTSSCRLCLQGLRR